MVDRPPRSGDKRPHTELGENSGRVEYSNGDESSGPEDAAIDSGTVPVESKRSRQPAKKDESCGGGEGGAERTTSNADVPAAADPFDPAEMDSEADLGSYVAASDEHDLQDDDAARKGVLRPILAHGLSTRVASSVLTAARVAFANVTVEEKLAVRPAPEGGLASMMMERAAAAVADLSARAQEEAAAAAPLTQEELRAVRLSLRALSETMRDELSRPTRSRDWKGAGVVATCRWDMICTGSGASSSSLHLELKRARQLDSQPTAASPPPPMWTRASQAGADRPPDKNRRVTREWHDARSGKIVIDGATYTLRSEPWRRSTIALRFCPRGGGRGGRGGRGGAEEEEHEEEEHGSDPRHEQACPLLVEIGHDRGVFGASARLLESTGPGGAAQPQHQRRSLWCSLPAAHARLLFDPRSYGLNEAALDRSLHVSDTVAKFRLALEAHRLLGGGDDCRKRRTPTAAAAMPLMRLFAGLIAVKGHEGWLQLEGNSARGVPQLWVCKFPDGQPRWEEVRDAGANLVDELTQRVLSELGAMHNMLVNVLKRHGSRAEARAAADEAPNAFAAFNEIDERVLWPAARQLSRFSDPFHAALFSAESRGALEDEEGRGAREGADGSSAQPPAPLSLQHGYCSDDGAARRRPVDSAKKAMQRVVSAVESVHLNKMALEALVQQHLADMVREEAPTLSRDDPLPDFDPPGFACDASGRVCEALRPPEATAAAAGPPELADPAAGGSAADAAPGGAPASLLRFRDGVQEDKATKRLPYYFPERIVERLACPFGPRDGGEVPGEFPGSEYERRLDAFCALTDDPGAAREAVRFVRLTHPYEGGPRYYLEYQWDMLVGNYGVAQVHVAAPPVNDGRYASGFLKTAANVAMRHLQGSYTGKLPDALLSQPLDPSKNQGLHALHGLHSVHVEEAAKPPCVSLLSDMLPMNDDRTVIMAKRSYVDARALKLSLGGIVYSGNVRFPQWQGREGAPRRVLFHPLRTLPMPTESYDEFVAGGHDPDAVRNPVYRELAKLLESDQERRRHVIRASPPKSERQRAVHDALALLVLLVGKERGWASEPPSVPHAVRACTAKELGMQLPQAAASGGGGGGGGGPLQQSGGGDGAATTAGASAGPSASSSSSPGTTSGDGCAAAEEEPSGSIPDFGVKLARAFSTSYVATGRPKDRLPLRDVLASVASVVSSDFAAMLGSLKEVRAAGDVLVDVVARDTGVKMTVMDCAAIEGVAGKVSNVLTGVSVKAHQRV